MIGVRWIKDAISTDDNSCRPHFNVAYARMEDGAAYGPSHKSRAHE